MSGFCCHCSYVILLRSCGPGAIFRKRSKKRLLFRLRVRRFLFGKNTHTIQRLARWWFQILFHPYLGKWSNLTLCFQMGVEITIYLGMPNFDWRASMVHWLHRIGNICANNKMVCENGNCISLFKLFTFHFRNLIKKKSHSNFCY